MSRFRPGWSHNEREKGTSLSFGGKGSFHQPTIDPPVTGESIPDSPGTGQGARGRQSLSFAGMRSDSSWSGPRMAEVDQARPDLLVDGLGNWVPVKEVLWFHCPMLSRRGCPTTPD